MTQSRTPASRLRRSIPIVGVVALLAALLTPTSAIAESAGSIDKTTGPSSNNLAETLEAARDFSPELADYLAGLGGPTPAPDAATGPSARRAPGDSIVQGTVTGINAPTIGLDDIDVTLHNEEGD